MTLCPNGHDSATDDFCDVCGMYLGNNLTTAPAGVVTPSRTVTPSGTATPPPEEACPRCGRIRMGRFCGACGFNFTAPLFTPAAPAPVPPAPAPAPPAPAVASGPPPVQAPAPPAASSFPYPQATWTAEVGPDRVYYERVQAITGPEGAAVAFPASYPGRRFQLLGNQMRIGRRSVARGLAPEIDLTGPPADPGISRLHAVLVCAPDGGWAVLDPGSANGTLVNGIEIPIGDHIQLRDGDRINLGAWTAITVHRD